jgi:large conductance mechanosensitive channel
MRLVREFKDFAMRGNVVDVAVGIVIGVAFGKIVASFVSDILMPPIGALTNGIDFSDMSITLKKAVGEVPAVTLNWGNFVTVVIDFIIVAFAIFMMIKMMNRMKRKEEQKPDEPAKPSNEEVLLMEIRDAIRASQ